METIWLQRSSQEIPWGFRLVGGREFGLPLTIQRVTPGSVAAAGLGPGDVILKVGNVMATNLEHNDAQELVRQAGNILQLTIKKPDGSFSAGPLSPSGQGFGNQMSPRVIESNVNPKGFGTGIPININYSNSAPASHYATTPRNFGSQHQPQMQGTRIDIQRVNPPQQRGGGYSNNYHDEEPANAGGLNFPDYTLAYRNQDPIHDSPGGPVNIRGYSQPNEDTSYSSKSLPRGGYSSNDRDGLGGSGGPPAYDMRPQQTNQSSFSPGGSINVTFNTGIPIQSSQQKTTQSFKPASQPQQPAFSSPQPAYNSVPRPFSPQGPANQSSGFASRDPGQTEGSLYIQTPAYESGTPGFDQSSIHGSGSSAYSTLPHSKPAYSTNNNNSFNVYKSSPQPFSAPKPFAPSQAGQSNAFNAAPGPFSPSQPRPYQSPMSPGSSNYPPSQPVIRKVSFDQSGQENGPYTPASNFSARPFKSAQVATITNYSGAPSSGYQDEYNDNRATDYGAPPAPQPPVFSRQYSKPEDTITTGPYQTHSGGPMSPRSAPGPYDYGDNREGYYSGLSDGMDNLNMGGSSRYEPPPPPAAAAPPPPPPPPPPGPPPPPAPPLGDYNPAPYRRQNQRQSEEPDEQKIPDQLLNTMLKSAKGGGPKPFSYGIDLSELKKKIGPPTAPKPRPGQPNYEEEEEEMPRHYGGPPKKPAGHVQSDYFVKRDNDQDFAPRGPKKPAGQVQADYYQCRQTGPRSEIDESPININMGTNPKKQSKSFKVLQWMTETENDDPGAVKGPGQEVSQKTRRSKDPERRHNADDDEMRFSGLHSKADIPSKAFGILQRISSDDGSGAVPNGKATLDIGDAEEGSGNFDESSVRYKGKCIPSPSFRVLQTWAEQDPDTTSNAGSRKEDYEDDELPENLNSDEMVDKRYTGGHIPSKVFKVLQKSLGDDTSESPSQSGNKTTGSGHSAAPISDF